MGFSPTMISRDISFRTYRVALWLVLFGAVVFACAVSVAPSGGPEDRTPPRVLSTLPAADSAGVAPDAVIRITFSEPIRRDGFIREVVFSPPVEIGRIRWKGTTASIEPYDSLHPDTTYVVSLQPGYRDEHNVAAEKRFEFAFATAAHLDTGRVSGVVHFRREPTKNAIVRGFVLAGDSSFTPESAAPDRETRADKSGQYTLRYLPGSNNRFIVWAFEDQNGNGKFDPPGEYGAVFADTLMLRSTVPVVSGRDIFIVDPNEQATVRGTVANETGIDTVFVVVGLYAAGDTLAPSYFAFCDTSGGFVFRVKSGVYAVSSFIDFAPDSVCGTYPCGPDSALRCIEPCVTAADSVRLEPGAEITLPELRLLAPVEAIE